MTANGFSLDESGALPWLAAILISVFAHALIGVLLLRSAPLRIVTPAATSATDIELADWPTLATVAAPLAPARPASEGPAPRLQRLRSPALKSFRAVAPHMPSLPPARLSAAITQSSPTSSMLPASASLPPLPGQPVYINTPSALSALQLWLAAVREQLERYKRYPDDARTQHQEDTVSVRISVDRSGNVLRVSIVKSHGHMLLDQEALQMVQQAAPLPPLPAELSGDRINVVVPIEFFLLQADPLAGDPLQ